MSSSTNTSENSSNNESKDQEQQHQPITTTESFNPYAILNISPHSTIEEIQKSYKLLSRSFHPDKQPIQKRENAQEYFVQLKSAYDILCNPTLKFIVDHFGMEGIKFVKSQAKLYLKIEELLEQRRDELEEQLLWMNNNYEHHFDFDKNEEKKHEDTVVVSASSRFPSNHELEQKAIQLFSEAVQDYNHEMCTTMKTTKPIITGSVRVKCNTTHSAFLNEGIEPISLDVDETKLAFTISQSHFKQQQQQQQQQQQSMNHQNVKVSCSASSTLKSTEGEGMTSGQLSFEYQPVQGTEVYANISSDMDMSTIPKESDDDIQPKLEIGSSRFFTNRTYVHANLSAPFKSFLRPLISSHRLHPRKSDSPSDFTLSLTTHRSLFQDKIRCTWIAGLALPDMKLQYGMISLTTDNFQSRNGDDDDDDDVDEGEEEEEKEETTDSDNQNDTKENNQKTNQQKSKRQKSNWFFKPPKYTLKFNLRMSNTPIQFTTEQKLSKTHSGIVSVGYGTTGWDLKVISTRAISKLCNLSLGVRHIGTIGFSTLFKIQRGNMNFSVPILVTTAMSPSSAMKSMYMTMMIGLIDAMIGDFDNDFNMISDIEKTTTNIIGSSSSSGGVKSTTKQSLAKTKEDYLVQKEKMKRERLQQIQLMRNTAETKTKREEMKEDGLVILMATYEVQDGDCIDVTIPLQFWIMNSALHLPPMSKSNMLGFYDVRSVVTHDDRDGGSNIMNHSVESWLNSIWNQGLKTLRLTNQNQMIQKNKHFRSNEPKLTVRYRHFKSVYEITISDHEELNLPHPSAMKLGGSNVM